MAWWIFQNVLITAILAAVVAAICRAGRIGPVGRHALWLLVLVKFVTPPLFVWPWAVPDPLGLASAGAPAIGSAMAGMPVAGPKAVLAGDVEPPSGQGANGAMSLTARDDRSASRRSAAAWPWLLGLWAAGSLCVLGIEIARLTRLARRVRRAAPADPEIARRVNTLSARIGLRPIRAVSMGESASPVIWCLGHPVLLWPADLPADSTDACVDGLLVHELAHVKRRDHFVGWIELAAGVIWWWNPLFWFVRSALREQAELACDAWVISALPNGRRAYAESLLALSGAAVRGTSPMAVIGIRATSRRVLERRLVMIMKGRAPLRLPWIGLLALALMAAATLPAWATAADQQPPPPPPVPVIRQTPPASPAAPAAPAPARATRSRVAPGQQPPPPPPPARRVTRPAAPTPVFVRGTRTSLPAEGQTLVEGFDADREAIQQEANRKIEARRETLVKALQDLQEQYTKAGKLDEAVAIRNFLRSGLQGPGFRYVFRREAR